MEIKASLKNLRIAPRKVRLVADMIRGMQVTEAKSQLPFLVKKSSPAILKLLNSAVANAKQNFEIDEENLYVSRILVESGVTMKRWMPRAMGRAYPIMKRTSTIKLVLDELKPTAKKTKKASKPEVLKPEEVLTGKEELSSELKPQDQAEPKTNKAGQKPYNASGDSKKRHFSRQTVKRVFRRKSI